MDRQKQIGLLKQWYEEEIELSGRKGHDYAGEDMLSNFKRMYMMCHDYGIDPSQSYYSVFRFYAAIKWDRLNNLLRDGKSPKNESVQDSIKDMIMYLKLMLMAMEEKEEHGGLFEQTVRSNS